MKDLNKKLNLEPRLVQFKGGHEIDQEILLQLR
jgi:hypothetical protein